MQSLLRSTTLALLTSLTLVTVSQAAEAPEAEVVNVEADSFRCIRDMTPVRHFFVDNLLGDVDKTVAAANAPKGAPYPTGSVVQLVPGEAMVKREPGFSPVTNDWEFFELGVSEDGTAIGKRGFAEVNNQFGKNCFACHVPARDPWDFICESDHGCEAIPIDHKMTGAIQRSDPRCGPAELEDGDRVALMKVWALRTIGRFQAWYNSTF